MYRVMLVDDEASVLKSLAELIDWSASQCEVVASASGAQEALSLLRKVPVQILVTDIYMPEMDGLALIAGARALNPALRCIVVSAHDEFDYVRRALTLGVENYLLKPVNASELNETLAKTIENIERGAAAPAPARAEAAAFRHNILDRWANSAIQDFELAERAALLQIPLDAGEYRAAVCVPAAGCGMEERLARSMALADALRRALGEAGHDADTFIDRHANLAAILYGGASAAQAEALEAALAGLGGQSGEAFAALGPAVGSAYQVDLSYKCAYAMLPYRHLSPGAAVARCADFPMAEAIASTDMLAFEQALENADADSAASAVARGLARRSQRTFALTLRQLTPYMLKLIACFDDSMRGDGRVPDAVLRRLRALPQSADAAALLAGFAEALCAAAAELKSRQCAVHPIVRRVLGLLAVSYGKDISLKTVADQVNMHPSYFGQLFREETGMLFGDYLTSLRLKRARNLLADPGRKIGEISAVCGIAQQSYFNRLFKKEYGVTPVEYRRELLKHRE